MKEYPAKVYLSASWRQSDGALTRFVVERLARAGVTVVGDHPEYQKQDPFDRPWTSRVNDLVSDCSAVVAVLPKREEHPQTTSPYMFAELLAADRHGRPLLLFCHDGVLVKTQRTAAGWTLHFGRAPEVELSASQLFDQGGVDRLLESCGRLAMGSLPHLSGPHTLPSRDDVDAIVAKFIQEQVRTVKGRFVFNVLPFSMKEREHHEVARAVFEETGLPCRITLDVVGEEQRMREQWMSLLDRAEFAIAEMTDVRDACLVEAGIVMGMKKKLFLLSRKSNSRIPYGLDDIPLLVYRTTSDLHDKVKQCCAEYKRKVYNLDAELLGLSQAGLKSMGGVPSWFWAPSRRTAAWKLAVSCWAAAVAFALLLWAVLVLQGGSDTPRAFISMALSLAFGLGSRTRGAREHLEARFSEDAGRVLFFSAMGLIVAVVALASAYAYSA